MELLADRDPEEARKLLDPVLERMMEAVHRYEGTVNQVMGDGIMALFGAPLAHEDHAVRACYAALRMQESVKRYAEGVRRVEGMTDPDPSGSQLWRGRGPLYRLRSPHGLLGHWPDHTSGRAHGADGRPWLGPHDGRSLRLAEGYIQVESLGPFPVKGLSGPVEVYEVLGVEAVRSRLHVTAARGLTQFVGREPEMVQLRLVQQRARDGQGQVIAVIGEPGVGKSRLYWEFTHSAPDRWLARSREPVALLWQGDRLPAGDRSAEVLLPDRSPG